LTFESSSRIDPTKSGGGSLFHARGPAAAKTLNISETNGDNANDLDGPLTRFSRSWHFLKSNISNNVRFMDRVSIEH